MFVQGFRWWPLLQTPGQVGSVDDNDVPTVFCSKLFAVLVPVPFFLSAAQLGDQRLPGLNGDAVQAAQNNYVQRKRDASESKKDQRRDP